VTRPTEPLVNGPRRIRDWPAENVKRICRLAGVREVCAHAMRGFSASLLARKGTAGDQIAAMLRHREESTTMTSYATKASVRFGNQKRLLEQLEAVKASKVA
jgi:integrase